MFVYIKMQEDWLPHPGWLDTDSKHHLFILLFIEPRAKDTWVFTTASFLSDSLEMRSSLLKRAMGLFEHDNNTTKLKYDEWILIKHLQCVGNSKYTMNTGVVCVWIQHNTIHSPSVGVLSIIVHLLGKISPVHFFPEKTSQCTDAVRHFGRGQWAVAQEGGRCFAGHWRVNLRSSLPHTKTPAAKSAPQIYSWTCWFIYLPMKNTSDLQRAAKYAHAGR